MDETSARLLLQPHREVILTCIHQAATITQAAAAILPGPPTDRWIATTMYDTFCALLRAAVQDVFDFTAVHDHQYWVFDVGGKICLLFKKITTSLCLPVTNDHQLSLINGQLELPCLPTLLYAVIGYDWSRDGTQIATAKIVHWHEGQLVWQIDLLEDLSMPGNPDTGILPVGPTPPQVTVHAKPGIIRKSSRKTAS